MGADHHDKALLQEARTHLTVYSETGSAAELAGRVGLVPDHMWNKGDLNKHGRAYETTAISYQVDRSADASPGEQLGELLERIKPLGERFRAESDAGNVVRLKLAVFEDADNIMFTLPAALLRDVGSLGIDLEFDIYDV
jgi:hypothetical protein